MKFIILKTKRAYLLNVYGIFNYEIIRQNDIPHCDCKELF